MIADRLVALRVRIEQIVWLDVMAPGLRTDAAAPALLALLDASDLALREVFPHLPQDLLDYRCSHREGFLKSMADWLSRNCPTGFVILVSAPVEEPIIAQPVSAAGSGSQASQASQDARHSGWLFGRTLDEAIAEAVWWLELERQDERRRAAERVARQAALQSGC